MTWHTSRPD